MKRMIFAVWIFVSFVLFADETNWIQQDGWVTGPGATGNNKTTYLLPFRYENSNELGFHRDEHPVLYETDMGWPVPDENESELKYLFFGDTYFFMRDNNEQVMSKIRDGSETLLDFDVEANGSEIRKNYIFRNNLPSNLTAICSTNNIANCFNKDEQYSTCLSFCSDLNNESPFWNYLDLAGSNSNKCSDFCMFDMVESYASRGYFLYDGDDLPEDIFGRTYNNGTSNIFLAAELDKEEAGNASKYNINFLNAQPEGSDLISAQVHSTTDNRRSKSIWMNSYERDFFSNILVGIYPRGYFYACAGSPTDGCLSKKLFVPYAVGSWDFLTPDTFCHNAIKDDSSIEINEEKILRENEFTLELERQKQSLGFGIYDFENECRVRFSKEFNSTNPLFSYSFPSCDTTDIVNACHQDYPNKHILWPNLSKMSKITVVQGIERDILSADDGKEYRQPLKIPFKKSTKIREKS